MNETREERRKRRFKAGLKNPKKDKWARRRKPNRSKNPLKIINPFRKKIKPKFEETEITEKLAKKRIEHLRKVFLGKHWYEKLIDWVKGLVWKILTKIKKKNEEEEKKEKKETKEV